jgi:hypothetical protein
MSTSGAYPDRPNERKGRPTLSDPLWACDLRERLAAMGTPQRPRLRATCCLVGPSTTAPQVPQVLRTAAGARKAVKAAKSVMAPRSVGSVLEKGARLAVGDAVGAESGAPPTAPANARLFGPEEVYAGCERSGSRVRLPPDKTNLRHW